MWPLLLTFFCGLFFLVGILFYKFSHNKKNLNIISIACACVVILGLMVGDLIPELIEIGKWWLIFFVIIGLFILIGLDFVIPHHTHHHHANDENTKDHKEHINHISSITIIALLLHNAVEGMALYGVALNDLTSGILMCLGIGLHNLPFGLQIASLLDKKKHKLLIFFLVLSGLLGGTIVFLFGNIKEIYLGMIIAVTLGMILHIFLFELLPEVTNNIEKKESIYGIIIGIVILLIINFI